MSTCHWKSLLCLQEAPTCLGLWEPLIMLEIREPEPSRWKGEGSAQCVVPAGSAPETPASIFMVLTTAWGLL